MGGADKDSDSAFLYQGFDAKTNQGFAANKYEWQKGNKKDGEYLPGKAKEFDEIFIGKDHEKKSAPYKSKASKFSPSMRKVVARSAARGQQGLGFGVTGKNMMMSLADAVNSKGGSHHV